MSLWTRLFGDRSQNETKSSGLVEGATLQERKDWFARTQPWQKVPAWLVHDVVTQLSGRSPDVLQLFVDTSMKARLVPQLEGLHRVEPASVALACVCGLFLRVGGPLAQEVLRAKRRISSSDHNAVLARDCLTVALRLSATPLAYPLLARLLVQMGHIEEARSCVEEGLEAVEAEREELDVDAGDDEFGELEELDGVERQLQEMMEAMTSTGPGGTGREPPDRQREADSAVPRSTAPRAPRNIVEYSKDTGKRGPDWMEHNVDPVLQIYFAPKPNDPAWNMITTENVAAYQLWFQRAVLRAKLYEAYSSETIAGPRAEAVCNTAFQAKEEHGLNPVVILVLAHQYIEADSMLRGLHTVDWVAFMMSRNNCAPSPESIVRFVIDFYGLQRTS